MSDSENRSVWIGPVGPIPIVHDIAPEEEAQNRADAAVADALHSAAELQGGMFHGRAGVRRRVVDRLVARAISDEATLPTLLSVLKNDISADVRFMVAMSMYKFGPDPRVIEALQETANLDPDLDVRAEAMYSLDQLGVLDE
ncbi:HEAT repeat domain-containing protein [Leifsonia sp. LS-T14]|uniref:HEAT repeat domain-containing protein n=1 Tax=unclassified Leifsonia TaxID=2663824 RepID=UPI0035A7241B